MEKRFMIIGLMLIVMAAYYGLTTGDYLLGAIFTVLGGLVAYGAKYDLPFIK